MSGSLAHQGTGSGGSQPGMILPQGTHGKVWRCVGCPSWEDAPGIKQAEAKDAVKHPETHRTAALSKELSGTRHQ